MLDQYKEKKPKDPTIREKFDTYRFADYKEKVIDLLMRVTSVSVEIGQVHEGGGAVRCAAARAAIRVVRQETRALEAKAMTASLSREVFAVLKSGRAGCG